MLSLVLAGVHAAPETATSSVQPLQPAGDHQKIPSSLLSCQSWCPTQLRNSMDQEQCTKLACAACDSCVNAAQLTVGNGAPQPLHVALAPSSKEPIHATWLPASAANVSLLTSTDLLDTNAFSPPLFDTSRQETALEPAKKIIGYSADLNAGESPDTFANESLSVIS